MSGRVWLSWEWRLEVLLALAGLGAFYALGWWRLRRRGRQQLANGWRLAAYMSGLAVVGVALLSPIDTLQSLLFSMHMVQHELLMMVAPPLLLLANPFPFFLWALPPESRRAFTGVFATGMPVRRVLRQVTRPRIAWLLYVGTLWLWHYPVAYDVALRYELVHDLEHMTFFWTAVLFWWHVVGAAPRIDRTLGYGFRIAYLAAALAQNEILAVAISFAGQPLYPYYTTVPRIWGLSVMGDQMLGGAIMWIPGGMMYVLAMVILIARLLDAEEKKPPLAESQWAAPEAVMAPGGRD